MIPLVLLPGIRGDPAEYARLVPRLGREVVVLPLPETEEDDLAAIAARLPLPEGPIDVVGASFGGLVAWALPPGRVRTLVTIGTVPFRTPAARRCGPMGLALRFCPDRIWREAYVPRARAALIEDGADDSLVDRMHLPPRRVMAARLRAIARWGLPDRPPAPATWIWGATDRFVTWDTGEVTARGMRPVVVPGGHRPHLSHPSEVARWLAARDRPHP